MVRHGVLTLLAALVVASPVRAQERARPQLLLTIFGGLTTSSSLWTIDRQRALNSAGNFDTLRLVRRLGSGLTLGASATLFQSSNVGLYGEIAFLGLGLDNLCEVVRLDPSPGNSGLNAQVCNDITQNDGSATSVGFFVGGAYRFAPGGFASPYVRVQGGITTRSASTTEVAGRFVDPASGAAVNRLIVQDAGGSGIDVAGAVAAGVMIPVTAGYQIRLEMRDHLLLAHQITGPATDIPPIPPTKRKLVNNIAFVVGLDIVLERRRGRRY